MKHTGWFAGLALATAVFAGGCFCTLTSESYSAGKVKPKNALDYRTVPDLTRVTEYSTDAIPVEVLSTGKPRTRVSHPEGLWALAWIASLGVVPAWDTYDAGLNLTVKTPIGEKEGAYTKREREFVGWVPYLLPFASKESDLEADPQGELTKRLVAELKAGWTPEAVAKLNAEERRRVADLRKKADALLAEKRWQEVLDLCAGDKDAALAQEYAKKSDECRIALKRERAEKAIAEKRWDDFEAICAEPKEAKGGAASAAQGEVYPEEEDVAFAPVAAELRAKAGKIQAEDRAKRIAEKKAKIESLLAANDYQAVLDLCREYDEDAANDDAVADEFARLQERAERLRVADITSRAEALVAEGKLQEADELVAGEEDSGLVAVREKIAALQEAARVEEVVAKAQELEEAREWRDLLLLCKGETDERLAAYAVRAEVGIEAARVEELRANAGSLAAEGKADEAYAMLAADSSEAAKNAARELAAKICNRLGGEAVGELDSAQGKADGGDELAAVDAYDRILSGKAELLKWARMAGGEEAVEKCEREIYARVLQMRALAVDRFLLRTLKELKAANDAKDTVKMYSLCSTALAGRPQEWWIERAQGGKDEVLRRANDIPVLLVRVRQEYEAAVALKDAGARWDEIVRFMGRRVRRDDEIAAKAREMGGLLLAAKGKIESVRRVDNEWWIDLEIALGQESAGFGLYIEKVAQVRLRDVAKSSPDGLLRRLHEDDWIWFVGTIMPAWWDSGFDGNMWAVAVDNVAVAQDLDGLKEAYAKMAPIFAALDEAKKRNAASELWQEYLKLANGQYGSQLRREAAFGRLAGKAVELAGTFKDADRMIFGKVAMKVDVQGVEVQVEMMPSEVAKVASLKADEIVVFTGVFDKEGWGLSDLKLKNGEIVSVLSRADGGKGLAGDAAKSEDAMRLQREAEKSAKAWSDLEKAGEELEKALKDFKDFDPDDDGESFFPSLF